MGDIGLDRIADKIAGLGVPGLVLLVVMGSSGLTGAAAMTAALSILGGPLGMAGGIGILMLSPLILGALTRFGLENVFKMVLKRLRHKGCSIEEIREKIDGYRISSKMKGELKGHLDRWA